jgi:hypothetical protein
MASGRGAGGDHQVLLTPLGVQAVDADDHLAPAPAAGAHGGGGGFARGGLGVGGDRVSRSRITTSQGSVRAFSTALALLAGM